MKLDTASACEIALRLLEMDDGVSRVEFTPIYDETDLDQDKISFTTNTAYIINQYMQHQNPDSCVDGKAYAWVRKKHDEGNKSRKPEEFIRVTFEVIKK